MNYRELLQFEPIESIIKLTDANVEDHAKQMLESYVISDRMADQLSDEIIEHLQFDRPIENKGLFIVGNYGTGKSHLMSVISTLAERKNASQFITNKKVAQKSLEIEGKFKVIRIEIGSVQTSLRSILINAFETHLSKWKIQFEFPPDDQITNNKESLERMMGMFNETYPDHGLLLVVDELLDYLRGRKEQELTLDLGFLREIGETSSKTRLRFMAGIQEMLYGNPRFNYVADSLQRIHQRFVQVSIVREDIAFVVSERLLKKTDEQKAYIREHLKRFTKLYHRLNEDLENYVNLFPIHPSYLVAFEGVNTVEKRVALQTISSEIKQIIDQVVPNMHPGLVSYDSYWTYIETNSTNKSDQNIREVISKHKTLYRAVEQSFPEAKKRNYQQMALKIINALAVHRLTTDDLHDKVGLTPENLRDDLFLMPALGAEFLLEDDDPSDFLKTSIEAALKEVQKTVSYQYISSNETNGQYYLDLKKDIDVDSLIQVQAETIEDDKLDRYYFDLLQNTLELDENTYISNVKIWRYDFVWDANHVSREGYLFFGAPNERSTAQPERDFYIYMLRPYNRVLFKDEHRPDEVFFEYSRTDIEFDQLLRLYAAAQDLALSASSSTKKLYTTKIDAYRRRLNKTLSENFNQTFDITYQGKKATIADIGLFIHSAPTAKNTIDTAAESFLTDWFSKKYPEYPSFGRIESGLTRENLPEYVKKALLMIKGEPSKMGHDFLSGLVLLDDKQQLTLERSGYIKWIQELLDQRSNGQVINYDELIFTRRIKGIDDIRYTTTFRLEPELLVVLLGAMLQSGRLEISIEGKTYNAMNFNDWLKLDIRQQSTFNYVKKPVGLPTGVIKELASLYDIGLPNYEEDTLNRFIRKLITSTLEHLKTILEISQVLKSGLQVASHTILSSNEIKEYQLALQNHKDFIETLQRYDTRAKLNNLRFSEQEVVDQKKFLGELSNIQQIIHESTRLKSLVDYLQFAQSIEGELSTWNQEVDLALLDLVKLLKTNQSTSLIESHLLKLKQDYITNYMNQHAKTRLNLTENSLKKSLLSDDRLIILESLAQRISLFQTSQLEEWKNRLDTLKACLHLSEDKLQNNPLCECKFRLNAAEYSNKDVLTYSKNQLQSIYENWIDQLINTLSSEEIQSSIILLNPKQRKKIEDFITSKELSSPIDITLVQIISDLLSGIEKIEISFDDLEEMMAYGSPLTIEEIREQFERLLKNKVGKQATQHVRMLLKK